MRGRWLLGLVVVVVLAAAVPARAHTESDLIAIPAHSEATLTLRPTHGCGDSPTVRVSIRAPVEGAVAVEMEGWTVSSELDGEGNTVLMWSDGLLPADQPGEFGVTFAVPDAVGSVLLFPAVQGCENGEDLAWISGDPESPFPAPRILVLPEGHQPAASIDEVPADVPGRDQLVEIVDTDRPGTTTTTTTTTTSTSTTTTTTALPAVTDAEPIEEVSAPSAESGASVLPWMLAAAAVVALGLVVIRRRAKS